MKRRLLFTVAFFATALSGCSGYEPRNSTEFRRAAVGAISSAIESFEVERPVTEVAETFRENGPKCLRVRVRTRIRSDGKINEYITTYSPTVRIGSSRAELHVQRRIDKSVQASKESEGGSYVLVADAIALGPNRTRIDFYRPDSGYEHLAESVRAWAHGTDLECPDMTKV